MKHLMAFALAVAALLGLAEVAMADNARPRSHQNGRQQGQQHDQRPGIVKEFFFRAPAKVTGRFLRGLGRPGYYRPYEIYVAPTPVVFWEAPPEYRFDVPRVEVPVEEPAPAPTQTQATPGYRPITIHNSTSTRVFVGTSLDHNKGMFVEAGATVNSKYFGGSLSAWHIVNGRFAQTSAHWTDANSVVVQ